MKRSILFASIILVLTIVTFAVAKQRSTRAKDSDKADKIEWEYLVIAGGRNNLSSAGTNGKLAKIALESGFRENYPLEMNLDKLGAEGWEVVTVTMTQNEPIYYLKRRKDATR